MLERRFRAPSRGDGLADPPPLAPVSCSCRGASPFPPRVAVRTHALVHTAGTAVWFSTLAVGRRATEGTRGRDRDPALNPSPEPHERVNPGATTRPSKARAWYAWQGRHPRTSRTALALGKGLADGSHEPRGLPARLLTAESSDAERDTQTTGRRARHRAREREIGRGNEGVVLGPEEGPGKGSRREEEGIADDPGAGKRTSQP